jgi:hypothetical protein
VLEEFYQGAGGSPPTLDAFFSAPMDYLRSEAAYTAIRTHFGAARGGGPLSPEAFQALHENGEVRLRPCADAGPFRTDGIVPNGTVVESPRTTCYEGEEFIELLVGTEWVVVASRGCFNPVRLSPPPPPPPKTSECRRVRADATIVQNGWDQYYGAIWYEGCNCRDGGYMTEGFVYDNDVPGRAEGWHLVCDQW